MHLPAHSALDGSAQIDTPNRRVVAEQGTYLVVRRTRYFLESEGAKASNHIGALF